MKIANKGTKHHERKTQCVVNMIKIPKSLAIM